MAEKPKTSINLQAQELLKWAGLKKTKIRLEILESLIWESRPLSHAELSSLERLSSLDRVTVYRNLAALQKSGIVHGIMGVDGIWRYCAHDMNQPGCSGNHPHFICLSCKTMICLTGQRLPTVKVPEGYTVSGKRLLVYGYCPACRKKSDPGADSSQNEHYTQTCREKCGPGTNF